MKYKARLFFNAYKDLEVEAADEQEAKEIALNTDFNEYTAIEFDFIELSKLE